VTTNPSLIRKAVENEKSKNKTIDIEKYIKEILVVAKGLPVSLEVISTDFEGMVEEGKKIYKIFNPVGGNVYIKIPVSPSFEEGTKNSFDGIKAIKILSESKIPVNCTLVFTPEQALLAAKAGAKFVSPFAGRVDDFIRSQNEIEFEKSDYFNLYGIEKNNNILEDNGIVSGIDLVEQIKSIFINYGINDTKVLASSIRNPRQLREAALAGADIATAPMDVLEGAVSHYKTMEGMKKFIEDVVPEYAELLKSD
jgi:transaldolase